MSDLGLLGSPMPQCKKYQIGPLWLSPSLETVSEGDRCQGTPMWPFSPAPTYWYHWQRMHSCPMFTAIKRTKEIEDKYLGEMLTQASKCLPPQT